MSRRYTRKQPNVKSYTAPNSKEALGVTVRKTIMQKASVILKALIIRKPKKQS